MPGADEPALAAAAASGADVLIQELEDFTPPARRAFWIAQDRFASTGEVILGTVPTIRPALSDDREGTSFGKRSGPCAALPERHPTAC